MKIFKVWISKLASYSSIEDIAFTTSLRRAFSKLRASTSTKWRDRLSDLGFKRLS